MAASKFTDETRSALLERFAAGVSVPDAARASDLSPVTVKGWLTRGRQESEGEFAAFAAAVDAARGAARDRPKPMDEDELVRVISAAARKGAVAAMKLRWEMILADRRATEKPEQPETGSTEALDELAQRRNAV